MSKPRRFVLARTVAVALFCLSILTALAVNEASAAPRWPGLLDLIRRYPWWTVLLFGVVAVLMLVLGPDGTNPTTASKEDLFESENRLHQHLDVVDATGKNADELIARLPPYASDLVLAASSDRDDIMKVVAPFCDTTVDPYLLAREWAASPPATLADLSIVGQLVVGELLRSYGQLTAAVAVWQVAVKSGATPRVPWLVRIALVMSNLDTENSETISAILAEAQRIDGEYPMLKAVISFNAQEWNRAVQALAGWNAPSSWEKDTAQTIRFSALGNLERIDEAITALQDSVGETRNAGLLLHLARLLRARSVWGTGDSRLGDALTAVEIAVRARNLRRIWRGDSAEAVAVAAEAAVIADDPDQVWLLARPAPDGQATEIEAADARVLPVAAMGAALTGRITQARELLKTAPEGYVKKRVEAEIVSAFPTGGEVPTALDAWKAAHHAAGTDEEKLHTLRGMALEGFIDRAGLDSLKVDYPDAVADIETTAEFMSISGPDADARLRAFEHLSPLASIRRADLRRPEDPMAAADILIDAMPRWHYPRLLLMALECYVDAGQWERGALLAQRALSEGGGLWSGRATVLRRIVQIQTALSDWDKVESACRALLEIDQHDNDTRWSLAHAQYRGGDPQDAWRTLNRAPVPMNVSLPGQAIMLLDLTRRYADAETVVRTALAMLRIFPDTHDMYAMAINAVTMRSDRTEVPDELNAQVKAAWESFFDRFPDSDAFTVYTIRDDSNPLADAEQHMRQQAKNYDDVIVAVRDQGLPLGVLDLAVGKPYSAIYLYQPLGYHRAAFASPQDVSTELDLARLAIDGVCLVDASALYTLALLPDVAQTLLSLISRPTITNVALRDLVAADDMVNMPSSGTVAYDLALERIVANENDLSVTLRHRKEIQVMLDLARHLRRIAHPAMVHLRTARLRDEPVWMLTLDAAKENDTAIWADDTGLRAVAHSLGIKTFGTQSLLAIARERRRLDDGQCDRTVRDLIRNCVVDLPFDSSALIEVAAEQNWEPRAVATVLSRGAAWVETRSALLLFRTAFRNSPESMLGQWARAGISGLRDSVKPERRREKTTDFVVIMLNQEWMRPDHAAAFIGALMALVPDEAGHITRTALKRVWERTKDTYSVADAVIVFMHIISRLNDVYRQYGAGLILQ